MAKDKNTVVTGCMLFEDNPAIIHESGAIWHRDFYITRINIIWMLGK